MARGIGVMFDVLHDLERQFRFNCREAIAATNNNQPVPCRDNKLDACSCCFPLVEDSNGKRRGGDV
jgi:hypothetical protein